MTKFTQFSSWGAKLDQSFEEEQIPIFTKS